MARLVHQDERGAVYVEFLISFFPLFLLFLAICQLALFAAAEVVVRHSAYAAVRSAIVVLEDKLEKFDGADCGSLSTGRESSVKGIDDVVAKLGIGVSGPTKLGMDLQSALARGSLLQQGARMVPIRTAALLPLLPLAPSESLRQAQSESVAKSLSSTSDQQLGFALSYTKAATFVSLHDTDDAATLAVEPIGPTASVTARVMYFFHCTVPVVRALMCGGPRKAQLAMLGVATGEHIADLVNPDARFKSLTATATLPNQGGKYYRRGAK